MAKKELKNKYIIDDDRKQTKDCVYRAMDSHIDYFVSEAPAVVIAVPPEPKQCVNCCFFDECKN